MAVWHALSMHEIEVDEASKFVESQKAILQMEAGQTLSALSSFAGAGSALTKGLTMPESRPFSGLSRRAARSSKARSIDRDVDDSSDEESVSKRISGVIEEETARQIGGYDRKAQWKLFSTKTPAKDYELAHMAHAFGIGLMYCDKSNLAYYGDEGPGFKDHDFLDLEKKSEILEMVRMAVSYAVKKTAASVYKNLLKVELMLELLRILSKI